MKKITIAILAVWFLSFAFYLIGVEHTKDFQIEDYQQVQHINQTRFEQPVTDEHPAIPIPKSIQDIDYPMEFTLDNDHQLVPTYAVRELFDHYLSTYGETDLDAIIKLVQSDITEHLKEPARSDALSLLKRYVDYKISLAQHSASHIDSFPQNSTTTDDPEAFINTVEASYAAVESLRKQSFNSEEYDNFFAIEDAQNTYMLEQLRINQDASLTQEEKNRQLELASALLPEDILESRQRVQQHANLRETVTQLSADGASEDEIFQARESELGSEAAMALAQLDNKRAKWKSRVQQFAMERTDILNSSMSDEDKATAIESLLTMHFEPNEAKRAQAIVNAGLTL